MLLTTIKERVAATLFGGGAMRDSSETNTVVLPEPVGSETPMRVEPDARASVHVVRQISWYGLRTTGAWVDRTRLLKERKRGDRGLQRHCMDGDLVVQTQGWFSVVWFTARRDQLLAPSCPVL